MKCRNYAAIQLGWIDTLRFSLRRQISLLEIVVLVTLLCFFLASPNHGWYGIALVAMILALYVVIFTVTTNAVAFQQWKLIVESNGFWVEAVHEIGTTRFFVDFSQLHSIKSTEANVSLDFKDQNIPILIGCDSGDIGDAVEFLSKGMTEWQAGESGTV